MWFKRHSVCKVCGVHFEPATGFDARWGDLCATHREPVKKADMRRDAVMEWAGRNVERVGALMDEDDAKQREATQAYFKNKMEQMQNMGLGQCSSGVRVENCLSQQYGSFL